MEKTKWLDVEEASAYLKLSTYRVFQLVGKKILPHYKPTGKKLFFLEKDLENFILKSKVEGLTK